MGLRVGHGSWFIPSAYLGNTAACFFIGALTWLIQESDQSPRAKIVNSDLFRLHGCFAGGTYPTVPLFPTVPFCMMSLPPIFKIPFAPS